MYLKKDKREDMFERISGDDASRQVYLFGYTRLLFSLLVAVDYYATSDYMNGIKLKAFGQLDDISNIIQAYEKTGTQQSIREYEKTKYPQSRERLVKKKKADVINDLRTEMFLDAENTLKEHINDHIFYLEEPTGAGKSNTALNLSFQIIKKVKNIHEKKPFEKTPEFVRVFGNVNLRSDLKCTEISNIDFVPANIILSENKVSVIDYEWTFTFPVPSQFLVYRMIFYYLELNDKRGILKERDFYEKAGILPEDIEVYVEMEHNFQQYILGEHTAMRNMYAQISPGRVEVEDYYREKKQESLEMLQIFWDNGKSFNEADSVRYLFRNGKIQTEFELPENTTMLRLDPGEMSKGLKIVKLTWEDESQVKFHTDGCEVSSGEFYFGGDDPQIIVDSVPENRKSIKIEMEILDRQTTEKKFWKVYAEQKRAMEQMSQELAQKKALVDQVEGSKAWKVYRAIKRV